MVNMCGSCFFVVYILVVFVWEDEEGAVNESIEIVGCGSLVR